MGRWTPSRAVLGAAIEVVAGVAVALGLVAVLDTIAPIAGLGVVPLLVVLAVAIRRGELAALTAAVLSVLGLNYFFIAPVHRLTIADSENVVTLVVFLISALVVGRLAAIARATAIEAQERAAEAIARENEAAMLAGVARGLVAAGTLAGELEGIGERVAAALGAAGARVELASAPSPVEGERAHRLPLADRAAWLYVREGREDPERVAEPLARLLDVALERERVAAQAAEADASRRGDVAKTAVLHAISHDLRSPLTAITTAADALAGEALADPDRDELVTVVREESARLARLIDDLLELSRIQAGAVHPRPDWCDLREVAARAVANVRVQRPDHAVEMLLPEDLPLVRADSAQLERVLTNLVENAAKFSPDDRAVAIRGGVGGGRVTVRVIDGGPGIPAAQRPQVFEPFFRGRPSEGGAGLGLAISRGFVEANGGRIVLQAAAAGETAFAVSFPLVPTPAVAG